MTMTFIPTLALLILPVCLPPHSVQGVAPESAGPAEVQPIKRLTEWPKADDLSDLRKDIRRLRAARTPEMVEEAHVALVKAGGAAAPHLIRLLDREKDKQTLRHMRGVLEAITSVAHTRLLSEYFEDRSPIIRIWALSRCATLTDPGLRAAVQSVLKKIKARGKKADPDERVAATLCLVSTGSEKTLEQVIELVGKDWKRWGPTTLLALEAVRGKAATERVSALLSEKERNRQLLGLRLLGGCLEKERAPIVLPFLEGSDNGLRIAAINLLRQTIDGEPPLDRLPVFEAIERANKWKIRLR
jgi:hypothetical protein